MCITDTSLSHSPEQRLAALAQPLPPPPRPLGAYTTAVIADGLLFLSGMLPTRLGRSAVQGVAGRNLDSQTARAAARLAALNALAAARQALGSLDRVERMVRLSVYIACTSEFADHARVADGASEAFNSVFGADRPHARLAIGVAALPGGMPVELEVIMKLR